MNHNDIIDKFCENPQILKELEPFTKSKDKLGFINKLIELINCDFDSARLVCDYLIDGTLLPSDLPPQEQAYNNAVAQELLNKPKCPTCNSTNITKISGTKRFVTTGLFGLASSNVGKTMECKNCGYKW